MFILETAVESCSAEQLSSGRLFLGFQRDFFMSKVLFHTEKGEAGTWSLLHRFFGLFGFVGFFCLFLGYCWLGVFFVTEMCYSFCFTVYTCCIREKKLLKESHEWLLMS